MNKTAKYLVIALVLITGIKASSAKNYTLSTHVNQLYKVDSSGNVLLITVTNTTSKPLNIGWMMVSNTVANTNWTYSYCDLNTCYTETSKIPTDTTIDLLDPNGIASFNLTVLHYNNQAKTGMLKIAMWDVSNPTDTNIIEFIIDATRLGVDNHIVKENLFKIYPNPVSDYITMLPSSGFRASSVEIYNEMGQRILVPVIADGMENRIPVADLPKGHYFINFRDKAGMLASEQFVKE